MKFGPLFMTLALLLFACGAPEEKATNDELLAGEPYTFERGFPTQNTAENVYAESDLRRAIEAYKIFVPTLGTEGVIQQMINQGAIPNKKGMVMATSPMQQFQATNSDTPYAIAVIDLSDGPVVIEMPANPLLLGFVNDHNMKAIQNVGGIGPEKGQGGKHLVVPANYKGEIPEGYFVGYSQTMKNVCLIRTVPLDGDVSKSIKATEQIKIYPLGAEDQSFSYIDVSEKRVTLPLLDWEGNLEFWKQLHSVISSENDVKSYRYAMGILAELGIKKGENFNPDERTKKLLIEAAEIAHLEMSVSLYANRRKSRIVWENKNWEFMPIGAFDAENGDFGTGSVRDLDANDNYYFVGWGTSSAIGKQKIGSGSMYYFELKDKEGAYFDGSHNYKLTIPGPIPAALFWSTTVYDSKTRCLIETPMNRAAIRSHLDKPKANKDGSYDIYFGPEKPSNGENWIQTNNGQGWWTCVRIYGPQEAAFDQTWQLNDIKFID